MHDGKDSQTRLEGIAQAILTYAALVTTVATGVMLPEVWRESRGEAVGFVGMAGGLWLLGRVMRIQGRQKQFRFGEEIHYVSFALVSVILINELIAGVGVKVFSHEAFGWFAQMIHRTLNMLVGQILLSGGLVAALWSFSKTMNAPKKGLIAGNPKLTKDRGGLLFRLSIFALALVWLLATQNDQVKTFFMERGEGLLTFGFGLPLAFYLKATVVGSPFVKTKRIS